MESSETSLKPASPEATATAACGGDDVTTDAVDEKKPEEDEAKTDTVEEIRPEGDKEKTEAVEENRPEGDKEKTDAVEENRPEGDEEKPDAVEENRPEGDKEKTDAVEENRPEGDKEKTDAVEENRPEGDKEKTDAVEENTPEGDKEKTDAVEENRPEGDEEKTDAVEENRPEGNEEKFDIIEENKTEENEMEADTAEDKEPEEEKMETDSTVNDKPEEDEMTRDKLGESDSGEKCLNSDNTNKGSTPDVDDKECSEESAEISNEGIVKETTENSSNVEEDKLISSNKNEDNETERLSSPGISPEDDSLQQVKAHEPTEEGVTDETEKPTEVENQSEVPSSDVEISASKSEEKCSTGENPEACTSEVENKVDNDNHEDTTIESPESDIIGNKASESDADAGPMEEGVDAEEKSADRSVNENERSTGVNEEKSLAVANEEESTAVANEEESTATGNEQSSAAENEEESSTLDDEVTPKIIVEGSEQEKQTDKNTLSKDDIEDSRDKSRSKGDTSNEKSSDKEAVPSKEAVIEDKQGARDHDKSPAGITEKMVVDDHVEGKTSAPNVPSAEQDETVLAMASADVDNECPDDAMEGGSHHEEDDPLSATMRDGEGDSQMDVDDSQDKAENTIMEIHEDLLRDEDVKDEVQVEEDPIEGDKLEKEVIEAAASAAQTPDDQSSKNDENTSALDKEGVSKSSETKGTADEEGSSKSKEDNLTGKEAEDDVCIIPDTVPQMIRKKLKDITKKDTAAPNSATSKRTRALSEEGSDDKEKSVVAVREVRKEKRKSRDVPPIDISTPRPQRQAARKAESQIKQVLAAVESYEQPAEEQEVQEEQEDEGEDEEEQVQPTSPQLTVLDRPVDVHPCQQCGLVTICRYQKQSKGSTIHFCTQVCHKEFEDAESSKLPQPMVLESPVAAPVLSGPSGPALELDRAFVRSCGQCCAKINTADERVLTWETMDFCNENCLDKYQTALGSHCVNCKGSVRSASLGKYCVRFGYDIKQFCCAGCLEEFKKGLKVCSYCQKDISRDQEGFLAPVGDKGQFKDFCTSSCMEKYEQMSSPVALPPPKHECAVCNQMAIVRVEVIQDGRVHQLCSSPCFAAFKFVNAIVADRCDMCKSFFDKAKSENFSIYYDDAPHSFCCKTCMNVYILAKRKIVPCTSCKVKKYNFDMIKKASLSGQVIMMCSLNCLSQYQVSVNAVSVRRVKCDACGTSGLAQYHLTMTDASLRNFCSYSCVGTFQSQFRGALAVKPDMPVPIGGPKRAIPRRATAGTETEPSPKGAAMPVISSVTSLAPNGEQPTTVTPTSILKQTSTAESSKTPKAHIIIRPPHPPQRQNCGVQVRPFMHNKGVSCRPQPCTKETQTDDELNKPVIIPIPVPIYVPAPMCMYSMPVPIPVPFPLPIPVPIFIPTTRNSTKGILSEIKRIQEKIPADPFEAELLMMAEMVAEEKKSEPSDSDSDGNDAAPEETSGGDAGNGVNENFSPDTVDTSNTFGEDMLQMALKFASSLDEPAVDFEAAVASSTIVPGSQSTTAQSDDEDSEPDDSEATEPKTRSGRKRAAGPLSRTQSATPTKRHRRVSSSESLPILPPSDGTSSSSRMDVEKPDANMSLKYTYGVNAWRQWVLQKNAQLEKGATNHRKLKLFKTDLLQLTSDELNYSLCLFVKEMRKPNGSEYAPDTIYYLCLGIQLYLIENGRVDNIFSDPFYEKFTECLDEVAKKFSALYDDTQFIVTRVEEEHLWESKQLGAHSPHVLLSTLMFFNTKHFNITNVDEHMLLSFSHIMKHWKRNNNALSSAKTPGRNVLLRFYPSQASIESNAKKKKVYEQSENEENPLRCPVKLYEFYLSKCPESVKTRSDVFYLQPERSCVPDSPVWYSTASLGKEPLLKMLRRVKMVKEINEAILK